MPVPHVSQWFAPVIGVIKKWFQADSYKADSVSPSLILDFANNRYAANSSAKNFSDILTFTSGSTRTYFNSSGVMQTAAADVPRFDHDPATGEALGLLVEGQRTNVIRNNTSVGAVSGVIGSGGVLPTNFGSNLRGLTLQITRDIDPQGVPSIRYKLSGTPTSTGSAYITFDANNVSTTVNGDVWTSSIYARLVSGSWANTTSAQTVVNIFSSGISWLQSICSNSLSSLSSTFSRISATGTVTNASAYYLQPLFQLNVTAGLPVDVEFDIGGIQLEKASFASSLILTSGSSVTRAADIVTNTSSNTVKFADWYNQSEGAVYTNCSREYSVSSGGFPPVIQIDDNSDNNRITQYLSLSGTQFVKTYINTSGVAQANLGASGSTDYTEDATLKISTAYKANDISFVKDGGSALTDSSATIPTVNRLKVGFGVGGTSWWGHIKELRYYPVRVSNVELQRITT